MRTALIAALLGSVVLAGCGSSDTKTSSTGSSAGAAATTSIAIKDFKFSPTPATVKAGVKIAISNADSAPHTLTDSSSKRIFDSGTITGSGTGSVTFTTPGTYSYFCEFHPYMKGTVTVTG